MSLLGFGMGTILANFHMCDIMLLFRTVLNMLVMNASPGGPMCFRCLMFSLYSALGTVVISGEDGTLVGVVVFSVIWSDLLVTSAISCPLWSTVYECQRVECAFTSTVSTECGMFVMCCI